jgi:hypothetical protein
MTRDTDCDMCRDDQDAAATQQKHPVNEPGRVRGASELDPIVLQSITALNWSPNRSKEEKRRWTIDSRELSQLRARDKTGRAIGVCRRCVSRVYCGTVSNSRSAASLWSRPNCSAKTRHCRPSGDPFGSIGPQRFGAAEKWDEHGSRIDTNKAASVRLNWRARCDKPALRLALPGIGTSPDSFAPRGGHR